MSDRVPPTDRPFVVIVRPRHFDGAVKENANLCLIAQALRATFPDLEGDSICVGSRDLRLHVGADGWCSDRWYHDGRDIVRTFDQGWLHPDDANDGLPVTFRPVPRPPFPG